jgi:hypothetical protein
MIFNIHYTVSLDCAEPDNEDFRAWIAQHGIIVTDRNM